MQKDSHVWSFLKKEMIYQLQTDIKKGRGRTGVLRVAPLEDGAPEERAGAGGVRRALPCRGEGFPGAVCCMTSPLIPFLQQQ